MKSELKSLESSLSEEFAETTFISYCHEKDNPEFDEKVRGLAKWLSELGVKCIFDRQVDNPPSGWSRWMIDSIENATFVLTVCTERYKARFEGKPYRDDKNSEGKGGRWEGAVLTQQLYEAYSVNDKIIPVILDEIDESDAKHIPTILRSYTYYSLPRDKMKLYGRLTGQEQTDDFPLGQRVSLPKPSQPDTSWLNDDMADEIPTLLTYDGLKEVIESLHEEITQDSGDARSSRDFRGVDLDKKDELNNVGAGYASLIRDHHDIYYGKIRDFLGNPANESVKLEFFEVVDELRTHIAVHAPEQEPLERVLARFVQRTASSNEVLRAKRSTLNILISFMYVNCDIGKKRE